MVHPIAFPAQSSIVRGYLTSPQTGRLTDKADKPIARLITTFETQLNATPITWYHMRKTLPKLIGEADIPSAKQEQKGTKKTGRDGTRIPLTSPVVGGRLQTAFNC